MTNTSTLPPGLLRRSQFRHLVPACHATLKAWIKAGKFPPPLDSVSSPRLYIWRSEDIATYLQGRWAVRIAPELLAFPRVVSETKKAAHG